MEKYVKDVKLEPVYDSKTNRFCGWRLSWNWAEPEFGCLETPTPESRFFKAKLFRNSYKAMSRFVQRMPEPHRKKLIEVTNNVVPIDVSNIKTVMYNTEQKKSRIEESAVILSKKNGDIIARYIIMTTYPGNLTPKLIGYPHDIMDVHNNTFGDTVITYVWNPSKFIEPIDALHAAEMCHATLVGRVEQNVNSPTK